ncbi:MAG: hypothetical protein OEO23_16535 [Gemmatimonadota bacterium]|nr:hypothetical protein [Gemmatimonadota bacterium]
MPPPVETHAKSALSDRVTQRWVRLTGQAFALAERPWLEGPVGPPDGIGGDFFQRWADANGLSVLRGPASRGLLPDLAGLAGPSFDPSRVHPDVRRFYEHTSSYELEAWSEWSGVFRPFGWILARVFSRRLQQLNVPLHPLDTSEGTSSEVLHLVSPTEGLVMAAWVRHLRQSGDVLYAGSYSIARVPGHDSPCVRVVFPLPNGNAMVFLRPSVDDDGAMTVLSKGRKSGDPGFYFTVRDSQRARTWVRYVQTMRESIRVYAAGNGEVRADHVMWVFGFVFLRLHYRLRPLPEGGRVDRSVDRDLSPP